MRRPRPAWSRKSPPPPFPDRRGLLCLAGQLARGEETADWSPQTGFVTVLHRHSGDWMDIFYIVTKKK